MVHHIPQDQTFTQTARYTHFTLENLLLSKPDLMTTNYCCEGVTDKHNKEVNVNNPSLSLGIFMTPSTVCTKDPPSYRRTLHVKRSLNIFNTYETKIVTNRYISYCPSIFVS